MDGGGPTRSSSPPSPRIRADLPGRPPPGTRAQVSHGEPDRLCQHGHGPWPPNSDLLVSPATVSPNWLSCVPLARRVPHNTSTTPEQDHIRARRNLATASFYPTLPCPSSARSLCRPPHPLPPPPLHHAQDPPGGGAASDAHADALSEAAGVCGASGPEGGYRRAGGACREARRDDKCSRRRRPR